MDRARRAPSPGWRDPTSGGSENDRQRRTGRRPEAVWISCVASKVRRMLCPICLPVSFFASALRSCNYWQVAGRGAFRRSRGGTRAARNSPRPQANAAAPSLVPGGWTTGDIDSGPGIGADCQGVAV